MDNKSTENSDKSMTITGLLKGFQDFVSRAKPVGGTANSYKTAMSDTLVYFPCARSKATGFSRSALA
jgi:hypothetical protein